MTVRMGVYYRQPDDAATFEKRYVEEHLPIVRAYDKIGATRFMKTSRVIAGDYPYAYVFVAEWADKDGMKADMASDKGKEAMTHAQSLGVGFDVVVFEELA